MNDIMSKTKSLSRRGFLAGTGGLTFAITVAPGLFSNGQALAADAPKEVGAWLTIAPDNSIVISSPAAEMGQGTMTGLLQVFAEEMDADWSKVTARAVPAIPAIYGNANGQLTTVGSQGVRGHFDKMRVQAAAVRQVLVEAAAKKWGLNGTDGITTAASVVTHAATGRKMSYGEIAGFATVPAEMPKIEVAALKPRAQYKLVGQEVQRLDIPAKTNGAAIYGVDVQVPGMVYATILRTPVEGNKPLEVDESGLKNIPGILKVMKLTDAVGIIGSTVEGVFAGRDALKVTWSTSDFSRYDSRKALTEFATDAADLSKKAVSIFGAGKPDENFSGASKVIKADYTTDYVYHAGMEPINVTAMVSPAGDGAELWMGTQSQSNVQAAAAAFLKLKPEQVKVNQHFLGGGFGRRSTPDMVFDALAMSKEMGKPVKLIWTRETDVRAAKLRPMTAHHVEAAFDASGVLTGWRHRIAAEAVTAYPSPERFNAGNGVDVLVANGAKIDYPVAHQATEYLREVRGAPLAAWRGIGAGHNKFVIEGFMDELAAAQKVDPIEFRLKNLPDPRGQAAVKAVAEMANWGSKPAEGRARGVSIGYNVNSWTAAIAEIALDRETGMIRLHKFWSVIDPGLALNPDMVKAQVEGCIVFGMSAALREQVTFTNGVVDQINYFDYRVARMSDTPEIETRVIVSDNAPGGIGEATLPNVAPAIANAFYVLTGKRLRSLPFTPSRVKAALASV